jgi:hypothetical protein
MSTAYAGTPYIDKSHFVIYSSYKLITRKENVITLGIKTRRSSNIRTCSKTI